jgi:MYXO-CTERM domain-containing protein
MGEGFTFVRDPEENPLHFSIEGEFSPPLEAFGAFPVAEITLVAAEPGGELLLADSSYIEALEFGKPVVFDDFFSAVPPDDVVAHVVPEPSAVPSLAAALALLAALGRARRR